LNAIFSFADISYDDSVFLRPGAPEDLSPESVGERETAVPLQQF
jgi:hypothetical protein